MCVCFFFLFKKKKIEHHWWCDFGAWNWKTTVGVAAKFQMSINLEASMWDTSIKVSVRLMLLPASWHSMTIWKRGCFLYPWPTAPVERIGGGRREGRCVCRREWRGGVQIYNPIYITLCLGEDPAEGCENQTPKTCSRNLQIPRFCFRCATGDISYLILFE